MDWGLIPEIFYDTVGRIVPGLIIILVSILLFLGPAEALEYLLLQLNEASIWAFLFLALSSYVIAIIMKQPWEVEILVKNWLGSARMNVKESKMNVGQGSNEVAKSELGLDAAQLMSDDLVLQYLRLDYQGYRALLHQKPDIHVRQFVYRRQ